MTTCEDSGDVDWTVTEAPMQNPDEPIRKETIPGWAGKTMLHPV